MSGSLVDLEAAIKALPGVLGCVILAAPDGSRTEIQAFTQAGLTKDAVEGLISAEAESRGMPPRDTAIHVFELEAESLFGDRQSLQRAAELAEQDARTRGLIGGLEPAGGATVLPWEGGSALDRRAAVQKVVLTSSTHTSEAQVSLVGRGEVIGTATGEKTPYGLAVVAQATLTACRNLVENLDADLRGASLVSVVGEDAVLVLIRMGDGVDLLGSALLRHGPASEAAVRATLDALNRVLLRR